MIHESIHLAILAAKNRPWEIKWAWPVNDTWRVGNERKYLRAASTHVLPLIHLSSALPFSSNYLSPRSPASSEMTGSSHNLLILIRIWVSCSRDSFLGRPRFLCRYRAHTCAHRNPEATARGAEPVRCPTVVIVFHGKSLPSLLISSRGQRSTWPRLKQVVRWPIDLILLPRVLRRMRKSRWKYVVVINLYVGI